MSNNRNERVAEEIKKVVSESLRSSVDDPSLNMVTITDVEVTQELENAIIFFTSLNDNKEEVQEALDRAKGLIRTDVAKNIRLRKAPELSFKYDNSVEYGNRIESLLNDLKKK